jgi:hypothetical protein
VAVTRRASPCVCVANGAKGGRGCLSLLAAGAHFLPLPPMPPLHAAGGLVDRASNGLSEREGKEGRAGRGGAKKSAVSSSNPASKRASREGRPLLSCLGKEAAVRSVRSGPSPAVLSRPRAGGQCAERLCVRAHALGVRYRTLSLQQPPRRRWRVQTGRGHARARRQNSLSCCSKCLPFACATTHPHLAHPPANLPIGHLHG